MEQNEYDFKSSTPSLV